MDAIEFEGGGQWPVNPRLDPAVIRLDWHRVLRNGVSARILHQFWVLDYVQDTSLRTRVGSTRTPWRERANRVAHVYPPRTAYWEWPLVPGERARGGYVVFRLKDDGLLRPLFFKTALYARIADPDEILGRLLKTGAQAVVQNPGAPSFWLAQSTLCALLGVIIGARPLGGENWIVGDAGASSPEGLVAQVDAYLKARLAEPVGLDDMARALHLSRSSLSHRYKALTGTSPMQTLLRFRIEQAKGLLVRGGKLDDIAGQCGFYDAAHLTRVFQARTGQTPRRFARTL